MNARILAAAVVASGLAAAALLTGAGNLSPAAPLAAPALADGFAIDGSHSSVVFKIKHMGVSNFYGRFNRISGEFAWDAAKPEATSVKAKIDAASVDSNNKQRDGHLNSPDFFNTKEFADINFVSKGLKKEGSAWKLTGDLTLVGKTKEVVADFTPTGDKTGDKGTLAGFEAVFTIKRSDFGMNYGVANGVLSDEVTVTVALEGKK